MLYVFSLNGTLAAPKTVWEPLPGRAARLGALRGQGHTVGIVCEDSPPSHQLQHDFMVESTEVGSLGDLLHTLGFGKDETFLVGSTPNDQLAARTEGIEFVWAKDFFKR